MVNHLDFHPGLNVWIDFPGCALVGKVKFVRQTFVVLRLDGGTIVCVEYDKLTHLEMCAFIAHYEYSKVGVHNGGK